MKSFKTFFTAIALTLIPFVYANSANANSLTDAIGRAQIDNTQAQAEEAKKPDLIINGRTIVTSDFGGSVTEYIQKYNRWNLEDRKIKVNDDCMSACTFLIGRLPDKNVCVSEHAQFAFHSAYMMTFAGPMFAKEATRLMWQYYPEKVKEKLRAAGWESGEKEHPDFIYVKGTDLFNRCED
jgi:hypothetical protein